ncbi:hypothetical protein T484DRAFT_1604976, partial [Baffinella frigidus]
CNACAAGTYKNEAGSTNCTACPVNTFSVVVAQTQLESCVTCPNSTVSEMASNSCEVCPIHSVRLLDAIAVLPLHLPAYCLVCPVGFWVDLDGDCHPCQAGTYSDNVSSTECTACPVNTFSTLVAQDRLWSCKACPPNT